jgi:Ca2+-binding RTX toxin-like protein
MRFPLLLTAAALAALAAAGPASAATVVRDGDTLVLRGVAAEANHLSVAVDDFDHARVRFTDRTSYPMTADPALGCTLTSSGFGAFASCPVTGIANLRLEGAGGNDELDVSPFDLPIAGRVTLDGGDGDDDVEGPTTDLPVTILGGAGNDALKGGQGPDLLDGGPGNDKVDGNDGNDEVHGGEGDDVVIGGRTLSADVIDGGPGRDTSTGDWYDSNGAGDQPLSVTFDGVANDGRPGEGDNVLSLEVIETKRVATLVAGDAADAPVEFSVTNTAAGGSRLVGTRFDDRLRTDSSDDVLEGGAGNDAIDAGFGSDTITPGPGRDTVLADGGAGACDLLNCPLAQGNDTINARDGEADNIDCGPGTDTAIVDAIDVLANCERVDGQAAGGGSGPGTGTPGGSTTKPGGSGAGTTKKTCRPPRIKAGTKLKTAKARLVRAHCKVKVKRVKSRRSRDRVVRVTRKGQTVTVSVSRGRR